MELKPGYDETVLNKREECLIRIVVYIKLVILLLIWAFHGRVNAQIQAGALNKKAISIEEAVRELPNSIKTPNRYALVIGVGRYEDERIPELPAASNDAQRLYEILIDPAIGMFPKEDVEPLLDEDVTRIDVVDALDTLARKVSRDDLVVIYFSGHGAVDEAGRSYWVMYNTRIDSLRASALSETEISELLSSIKTTRLVTFIDACYSASTAEVSGSKSWADLQKIYPEFKGDGRVAITASKGDQLSVVIKDKNHPGYGYSAFTWNILSGMKGEGDSDKDGVVTVSELWNYVKDRTETTARQQGGNQQPQLKGQIGSKFLLTVDGERLVANSQQFKQLIGNLQQLFLAGKLTPEQYKRAETLLKSKAESLDQMERERRQVYVDLASGKLDSRYLQAALDAIETPEQRKARLEREAREEARRERERQQRLEQEATERERREKFTSLMAQARARDNKREGKEALNLLEEALRLYPGDFQALALQKKIQGYFGPNPGDIMTNSIGMKLVWIPPGEFMMGSPSSERDRDDDEGPIHRVTISKGFWMGQSEVTRDEFVTFINETSYRTDAEKDGWAHSITGTMTNSITDVKDVSWRDPGFSQGDTHPVVCESWNDAMAFCDWLSRKEEKSYRLPTEAEWEYACRSGSSTVYHWGDDNKDGNSYCNVFDQTAKEKSSVYLLGRLYWRDGYANTSPVRSFKSNAFGLYDIAGNVWEWCSDWYGEEYYSVSPSVDPQGPSNGLCRVLRGGSCRSFSRYCRSASREHLSPIGRLISSGFRVVISPANPSHMQNGEVHNITIVGAGLCSQRINKQANPEVQKYTAGVASLCDALRKLGERIAGGKVMSMQYTGDKEKLHDVPIRFASKIKLGNLIVASNTAVDDFNTSEDLIIVYFPMSFFDSRSCVEIKNFAMDSEMDEASWKKLITYLRVYGVHVIEFTINPDTSANVKIKLSTKWEFFRKAEDGTCIISRLPGSSDP